MVVGRCLRYEATRERETASDEVTSLRLTELRGWLRGAWGVVFSHADDFACYGFEVDRWLVHVQDAFAPIEVRPISVATPYSAASVSRPTWVANASGATLVPKSGDAHRLALHRWRHERALLEAVGAQHERFVMVIDDALRVERLVSYRRGDTLPSALELARMASNLRRLRQEGEQGVTHALASVTPIRPVARLPSRLGS